MQYIENLEASEAYISKIFDLNDTKFSRVVKMPFSTTFQKFAPVSSYLYDIVFDEVIWN